MTTDETPYQGMSDMQGTGNVLNWRERIGMAAGAAKDAIRGIAPALKSEYMTSHTNRFHERIQNQRPGHGRQ